MRKLIVTMLFSAVLVGFVSAAQAQYGIGQYERLQILAADLEGATRQLYFQAERRAYPFRGRDSFALDHIRTLTQRAAIFRQELQRTEDPVRLRSAYQRLISAYSDARYAMRGYGRRNSDFVAFEFRNVARAMDHIGRSFSTYFDRRYDRDNYGNFDNDEYGNEDYEHEQYEDDEYEDGEYDEEDDYEEYDD